MLHSCLIVLLTCATAGCVPVFKNGSYTDVYMVFDRGMTVDSKQQQNLQKLIEVASHELYVATHGMAYFEEVVIVAHKLKTYTKFVNPARDFFSNADIRIVRPNVEHGSNPYTLQTGECGEQGKFIRFTPSFYEDLNSDDDIKYAARRLLKEWAHYRYGVFDEQISFGWEGKEISPGTCVDGIQGWAMTEAFEQCILDCGRVRSDCRFFPDLKSNSGMESSLMSLPHIPEVKYFCNGSNHNRRAPSMQNKMCDARSIMEVILEHKDFKDAHRRKLETTKTEPPTRIIWTRLERHYSIKYFIFVIESSQMMEKEISAETLQQFLERFFVYLAPKRSEARLMTFSNETKASKLVEIWQKDRENDAIEFVFNAFGSPSDTPDIGKALDKEYDKRPHHATLLLISTGDGTIKEEHYQRVKERNTLVHTIAVGSKPSWKLDRLSHMAGGDSYFLGDKNSTRESRSFDLDMAFLASLHSVVEDRLRPVVIWYERITLKESGLNYYYFQVDDGIGRELVVTVSRNDTDPKLLVPYTFFAVKEHKYEFGSSAISLIVDDMEPGTWELVLRKTNQEEEQVDVMITAKPSGSLESGWIWVRAWIANVTEEKKGMGTKGHHRIYAEVKKGYSPVIDATVIATVEIPGQRNTTEVTLRDNGAGPDVFKDDGIYTNFLPVMQRPAGRPLVIIKVSNDDGKAKVKSADCKRTTSAQKLLKDYWHKRAGKNVRPSKRRFSREDFETHPAINSSCDEWKESEEFCAFPLEPFTRAAMANSPIMFEMDEADVQRTPPAAIRDLKVVKQSVQGEEFFALLQWTSPEHPRRGMKVSIIEIRASKNRSVMIAKDFPSMKIISPKIKPLPSGEIQQSEVIIPPSVVKDVKDNSTIHIVYLAIRAQDSDGNTGEMSNVAEAFFEKTHVGETLERLEAGKGKSAWSRPWMPWTVGAIGVVVLIVVIVLCTIGYRKWKEPSRNMKEMISLDGLGS